MKRFLLAVVGCILLGAPANAQQWISWYGDAIIENPTPGCASTGGTGAGSYVGITYNPAGLGTNGADSFIATFNQRSALSMRIVGGSFSGGDQEYIGRGVSGNGNRFQYPSSGSTTQGTIVSFSQDPPTLTETTQYVAVQMTVSAYFGNGSCTLSLRSYLVRRVGPDGGATEE